MWPPNFNSRDIIPSLSTLVLKLKEDATKTVMTLARIAQKYQWGQEFLENILQELEAFGLEDRACPLLDDVIKNESKLDLWKACQSELFFEQQTAVRLLLLVCKFQGSYVFLLFHHIDNLYNLRSHSNTICFQSINI